MTNRISSKVIVPNNLPLSSTTGISTYPYFWKDFATSSWGVFTGIGWISVCMILPMVRDRAERDKVARLIIPTGL